MEADSTTYDNSSKAELNEPSLPFNTCPGNYKLYQDFVTKNDDQRLEIQLVQRLQTFGLLLNNVKCTSNKPDCQFVCRRARVVDRVQWACSNCGKRQPVRLKSFFFRLQCSLLQAMQIILAWCEDADVEVVAEHFGTKPRVAALIYDKLDELAAGEHNRHQLGGENCVVLAEMYPDCVNRLSPDTTDQPHVHRILMLADTKHVPTSYKLHVIKDDGKKSEDNSSDSQILRAEIERVVSSTVVPNSVLVRGGTVPRTAGAVPLLQLLQHCDVDMHHFLSSRIWRQALTLCAASRDLCDRSAGPAACGPAFAGPAACGPAFAGPAACGPAFAGPAACGPAFAGPAACGPAFAGPAACGPAFAGPAACGPAFAGPAACGPAFAGPAACGPAVQRYLNAALYRLRHGDGFYEHMLRLVADQFANT